MAHTSPAPRSGYGPCPGCGQIKHVDPDGTVHVHNRYRTDGVTATPERCSGSGSRPLDDAPETLTA